MQEAYQLEFPLYPQTHSLEEEVQLLKKENQEIKAMFKAELDKIRKGLYAKNGALKKEIGEVTHEVTVLKISMCKNSSI